MSGFISEPERRHEEYLKTAGSRGSNSRREPDPTQYELKKELEEVEISAGQKMLSAMSGSLLTSLLVTPLDVVRVRLQSQPSPKSSSAPSAPLQNTPFKFSNLPHNIGITSCCREVFWVNNNSQFCMVWPKSTAASTIATTINQPTPLSGITEPAADCAADASRQKTFNSTLDGLRKIARNEGIPSLWRGLSPTLLMSVPGNVIYFTGYDWLRSDKHDFIKSHFNEAFAPLIAGSVARVAAATVVSPIEMFRTRMQAATSAKGSVFTQTINGMKAMVRIEGYSSLWRGLGLTMWRDVPFSGLYWWGYEGMRDYLTTVREAVYGRAKANSADETSTFIDSFIAGATSGAFAAILTTPFDVAKTRKQVMERSLDSAGKPLWKPEAMTMQASMLYIKTEEGISGLFKGWAARCLKVAPACAIMISSYEVGKRWAKRRNEEKRDLDARGG